MSLQQTVSADRVHIAFFGRRNVGKSSLVNAVLGQSLSVVSDVKGTTTDPVSKAMELAPVGPVLIIDTPGLDDEGTLGLQRVEKAREILGKTDVAVLVTVAGEGLTDLDRALIAEWDTAHLPYLIVQNKTDTAAALSPDFLAVSAKTGEGIDRLKEAVAALARGAVNTRRILGDLLTEGETVLLVTPIDKAAPKGRLILPQQQTLRDILDSGCVATVCRDTELPRALDALCAPPRMVVTDSQVFDKVSKIVPPTVPLTSFSILMARYKGTLAEAVSGAAAIDRLQDGDTVLISEGCSHHRQCGDIGSQKLPLWLQNYTGKVLRFAFTSGGEFPKDLGDYALVLHCGGCMLNEREMTRRARLAKASGVPMTNYGVAIAYLNGILKRSVMPFEEIAALLP